MKYLNLIQDVHTLKEHGNVKTFMQNIIKSGAQEDAFYVCDMGDFVKKDKIWKTALPRVEAHYAVKCNDTMIVIQTLAALGIGFDCASKYEIDKVMSLGVRPERIIFANTVKPVSHVIHAEKRGVQMMTFDNAFELEKVKKHHPKAKLVIRIKCDAEDAQCLFGMKFGCDPDTEAPELLQIARSLDLDVIGVSFHVGSGCREFAAYSRAIEAAQRVFKYASTIGYDFKLLDLGGGYPGDYGPDFGKIAERINVSLEENFSDPSIRIIAEPGRFYVHTAYTLACNIHSTKDIMVTNPDTSGVEIHRMYYINDGVYGSFNGKVSYNEVFYPQALHNFPGMKHMSCSIWGPTCDSLDRVVENVSLPEMKIGDWILFEEMGSYTISIATNFNGFPVPKVFVVADEYVKVLLKDRAPITTKNFVDDSGLHDHVEYKYWFNRILYPITRSIVNVLHLINAPY